MGRATFLKPKSSFGLRLLADLPGTERETITSAARERRFWRGQSIFYEGDPIREVLMSVSGYVKLTQTGINGNEAILRLIGPGEIVGTVFRCDSRQYCTAQALQKSVLLAWDIAVIERLLEKFPGFRRNVINAVQETLIQMEQRFRRASTEPVESRLSSELLHLAGSLEPESTGKGRIVLSQAELGQLTGTGASTVSRLLREWQTRGIVAIQRKTITVQNSDELARLAESARQGRDCGLIATTRRFFVSQTSERALVTVPGSLHWQKAPLEVPHEQAGSRISRPPDGSMGKLCSRQVQRRKI